jgi:hypothetical protein
LGDRLIRQGARVERRCQVIEIVDHGGRLSGADTFAAPRPDAAGYGPQRGQQKRAAAVT